MQFAKLISVVLHPFICAVAAFLLLLSHSYVSFKIFLFSIIIITIATVVVPLIQVTVMKKRGHTASLDIPEKEKRISPFSTSIIAYLIALMVLWLLKSPLKVQILMWAYAFNTFIATIITKYWKISIHGMALGGPIAALGMAVSPYFFWGLFLAVPMTYSRVKLEAHTPAQVIAGFILGFALTAGHFRLLGAI